MFAMLDLPADNIEERRRLGRALALLREEAGMSQQQAADACGGMSVTGWQNYEHGKRRFTPDLVRKVTDAIGYTPEDLMIARARVPTVAGSADLGRFRDKPGRIFELPMTGRVSLGSQGPEVFGMSEPSMYSFEEMFGGDWKVLPVADEVMIPYVSPGGHVTYHATRTPSPGRGCVVELTNGAMFVRRFEAMRGGMLFVSELYPEPKAVTYPLTEVRGVHALGLRMD